MPDDEFPTREELIELFKEWETDYALRREEEANRRLPSAASGGAKEPQRSAEILPFPAARARQPWPSEIVKEAKRAPQADGPAKDKGNDSSHSM